MFVEFVPVNAHYHVLKDMFNPKKFEPIEDVPLQEEKSWQRFVFLTLGEPVIVMHWLDLKVKWRHQEANYDHDRLKEPASVTKGV